VHSYEWKETLEINFGINHTYQIKDVIKYYQKNKLTKQGTFIF
jgi:hypothetical protein